MFRFILSGLVSCAIIYFSDYGALKVDKKKVYVPPPKEMKLMTFGYNESLADSLWLRWIQDFDVCGKQKKSRQEFESESNIYTKNGETLELGFDRDLRDVCGKGWSYRMLDAVTDIAPKFRIAYSVGATSLSVLVDDHEGAKEIYDKATKQFPTDWNIHYKAAYHYMYELDNPEKAAGLLKVAGENGAPRWVKSLAARMFTKTGQLELGIRSLKDYLKILDEDDERDLNYREKIVKRIEKLEKEYLDSLPKKQ